MNINIIRLFFVCCILGLITCAGSSIEKQVKVNFYVGDDNYTKILRHEFQKNNNHLVAIMFTNKNCQTCDTFEGQLQNIQKTFLESQIPIFRCEISKSIKLNEKFKIKRFPMIHFVLKKTTNKKGDFQARIYKTNHIVTDKILESAKYLKRILQYQSHIITGKWDDLNKQGRHQFINTLNEIPRINRIIVNLEKLQKFHGFDEAKFIDEIVLNQSFNNMVIVPLSNQLFSFYKVTQNIKNQISIKTKEESWIIVSILSEKQNQFRHIPISNSQISQLKSQNFDLLNIFKSFLLYSVQQFTEDIFQVQTKTHSALNIRKPIYLAVLDSIWQRNKSLQYLDMLNKIMFQFQFQVNIFWTEAQLNSQKKVLLGFNKQQSPPLFGKLILTGNQPKQPLRNQTNEKAIFKEQDIRRKISEDLGFQIKLIQKILHLLGQLGLIEEVKVVDKMNILPNQTTLEFIYCTNKNMSPQYIENIVFLVNRFKRFYLNSKLTILTPPSLLNSNSLQQGFYMVFKQSIIFLSSQAPQCEQIQTKIKQISDQFAHQINRISLVPQHFCIPQSQMINYLMILS